MADDPNRRLLALLARMGDADREVLLRFAEFLARDGAAVPATASGEPAPVEVPEPEAVERPADEKVVEAVRRLSRTYFMLDKKSMLGATSDLVTQHILQGRDAAEVIDELERVFLESYERMKRGEE